MRGSAGAPLAAVTARGRAAVGLLDDVRRTLHSAEVAVVGVDDFNRDIAEHRAVDEVVNLLNQVCRPHRHRHRLAFERQRKGASLHLNAVRERRLDQAVRCHSELTASVCRGRGIGCSAPLGPSDHTAEPFTN